MQSVYGNHVMEEIDFNGQLSREFLVASVTWSTAAAANTVLASLSFPDLLFGETFIAEKTDDFRYFQAGIELGIRCTANKFVYGKIMITWQPYAVGIGAINSMYTSSSGPHVLVSATAEETCIFRTPFVHRFRFVDLASWVTNEMGLFKVFVLNPLTDINGDVNTATVFITARFIDVKMSMPYSGFIVSAARREMIRQMKQRKMDVIKKGVVAKKRDAYVCGSNCDAKSVESYDMEFHTESRSLAGAESRAKSSTGLISSTLENLSILGSSMSSVPLVANYAKAIQSVTKPMSSLSKMMGLSKPMNQNVAQSVRLDYNWDVNYGKGASGAMKLAMDPENAISTQPIIAGVSEDEMLLTHIVGTPTLIYSLPFTSSTAATAIGTTHIENNACYVDFVCSSFYYFAGSYKFKIYITASLMHNVRLVFYLLDPAFGTDWQYSYHRIVEVKGDCEVDFMIPYTYQRLSCTSTGEHSGFLLMCQVLTWSTPNPTLSLPIYLNVYKAGASDFRFGAQLDNKFTCTSRNLDDFHCQSNPREDFNKDFQPFHPSFAGYSTRNFTCGEEFVTLREVLHRYHPYNVTPAEGYDNIVNVGNRGSTTVWHGIEYWGLLFRFWRGSMRFKLIQNFQKIDGTVITKINGTTLFGLAMNLATANDQTSCIQFEVPYYENSFMNDTQVASDNDIQIFYDNQPRFLFKAAGDDFSFHFLCGIGQVGTISNWNTSTTGYLGLQDYLDV